MHTCMSSFTLSIHPTPALEPFVRSAAKYGFEGIDYPIESIDKLAREKSPDFVKELIATHNLHLASFLLPVEFHLDEITFKSGLENLPRLIKLAKKLHYSCCCTWIPPSIDQPPVLYLCRIVKRFRQCIEILNDYDIPLAIEWIGPAHLRTKKYDFIYTLEGAMLLKETIGLEGVGLLLDSFHWFTSESNLSEIKNLSVNDIVHVHVNDAPNVSIEKQLDNKRLFPGKGIIDLKRLLGVLKKKGYQGYLSVETLNEKLFSWEMDRVVKQSKKAINSVLKELD